MSPREMQIISTAKTRLFHRNNAAHGLTDTLAYSSSISAEVGKSNRHWRGEETREREREGKGGSALSLLNKIAIPETVFSH